jgi:hypothetical protein
MVTTVGAALCSNHNGYQQQQRGGDEFRPQYREASAQEYAPSPAMSKYAPS